MANETNSSTTTSTLNETAAQTKSSQDKEEVASYDNNKTADSDNDNNNEATVGLVNNHQLLATTINQQHQESEKTNNNHIKQENSHPSATSIDHVAVTLTTQPPPTTTNVTVACIIGEFGYYQLSLTILAFIRYVCVAMMTNSGPLIAPELAFSCSQIPNEILHLIQKPANETLEEYLKDKCFLSLNNGTQFKCSNWSYNTTESGITLTDTFDLVCDNHKFRSVFQSTVSIGVVLASVIWGSFSDRFGRNNAIRICFFCSLISGLISYLVKNFIIYTLSRALCSFGDLGLVVSLSTIIVETLGNKYRGAICIIVYTGWSMGVMIMPWLTDYFRDFRQLMLFTVVLHLLTLPWLITVGESIRWSLVNGKIEQAGQELERVCRWNFKTTTTTTTTTDGKQQQNNKKKEDNQVGCSNNGKKSDKLVSSSIEDQTNEEVDLVSNQFNELKKKYVIGAEKRKLEKSIEEAKMSKFQLISSSIFSGLSKVTQLFQTKELAITTITLVWTTFNSELLYMFFILINSDIGDSVKLNYLLGGIMETLATILSLILIWKTTRKFSLVSTLACISCLCFALAFTHDKDVLAILFQNLAKLAISNLSSLIYVTTTEAFPTNLRQTGFGVSGTLGSLGAVVAPFIRQELTDFIGMTSVMFMFVVLTLSAVSIIPFFLRETKGVELADEIH